MAIIKEVTERLVCDVCGETADGEYWEETYVNGNPERTMYCPHDLCQKHMSEWACSFSKQSYSRYGNGSNEETRKRYLDEFKKYLKWDDKRDED